MSQMLAKLQIVEVFTYRELTLALHGIRDILFRRPISCLFIQQIDAFSDIEKLVYKQSTRTNTEHVFWANLVRRLIHKFNLLCIATTRFTPLLEPQKGSNEGHSHITTGHTTSFSPYPPETMSSDWSNHVTHKIQFTICPDRFMSFVRCGSLSRFSFDAQG
ncbi:unnamed protein product [Dicrocoelium dendriticum]|nr:unnamed protein product [Dicrocoelium dendriticum]